LCLRGLPEGVVKLETCLGTPLPDEVYLAVAGYGSPDAGSLEDQAPAGNGNGNIEAVEYVTFPLTPSGIDNPPTEGGSKWVSLTATPNPFRGAVSVELTLPHEAEVSMEIYDVEGRRLTTLGGGPLGPGSHTLTWTGRDRRGQPVASGVYFLRLRAGAEILSRRVTLIR
jgi:hypothetical protein